jgi:hypothetical protein
VTGESRKALPLSQDIERANIVHLQVADGDVVMFGVFIQAMASGGGRGPGAERVPGTQPRQEYRNNWGNPLPRPSLYEPHSH